MLFNRIINDIIDWVRRLLYWKDNAIKKKPYSVIEVYQCKHGLLRLVERDTPRAVMTFIYTPKPVLKTNVALSSDMYDYHICLDHLWSVDNAELHRHSQTKSFMLDPNAQSFKLSKITRRKLGDASHTITIMKSSRKLDPNGDYESSVVYYNQFDFVGRDNSGFRDKYANIIFKDVVNQLKEHTFDETDWAWEINFSQKRYMGGHYIRPEELHPIPQL